MLPDNPLIVQSDRTLMLHTVTTVTDEHGRPRKDEHGRPMTEEHPRFAEARDRLAPFAELEKSPDYLHTYRVTAVSIWNAAALRFTIEDVRETLEDLSCVPVPENVLAEIASWIERYGLLRIERVGDRFELLSHDVEVLPDVLGHASIRKLCERAEDGRVWVDALNRGTIKQALIKIGFPVDDRGGFLDGDPLPIALRTESRSGNAFALRPYQENAAAAFHAGGSVD
ncbi:MAG: helicase-associated domain-containing protein, partial [Planctomycetota bacterium]|nr:helicase-associated domain-containing protein [Planctomycetota bacterium]